VSIFFTPKPEKEKRKGSVKDKVSQPVNLASGDDLEMSYCSAEGDISERIIIYRKPSEKNGHTYIGGIGTMRHSYRTFRADRVLSAVHIPTGEWFFGFETALA